MLDLSFAIQQHLAARGPRDAHLLVTIQGINRQTDQTETIGFWTGKDHEDFTIEGQSQTFYGAGTLLKMNPLTVEAGLQVRTQRIVFSSVAPEVELAARGYKIENGPVRLYVAYFDPLTKQPIDDPVRRFKGKAKGLKINRPAKRPGDKKSPPAEMELSVRSVADQLTKTLALKKSDAALQARTPGDALRRYTDVGGSIETVWGETRAKAPEAAETTTASTTATTPTRVSGDR